MAVLGEDRVVVEDAASKTCVSRLQQGAVLDRKGFHTWDPKSVLEGVYSHTRKCTNRNKHMVHTHINAIIINTLLGIFIAVYVQRPTLYLP